LLEAAMALFADKGQDVTVSEITQAAGVAKGTFYVYFASKTELIAALREAMIADYHARMAKAIADNSPVGFSSDFSSDVVGVAVDFLSSELHSVLFPTAADQAQGEREVVHGFEEFLIDANSKGMTNVPDPYWFAVLLVGAANFAVRYSREAQTFDRDALVSAIVELRRRALEL
jgi:AcrR family transcriptional regulator